jgi:hypothetical protein
VLKSFWSADKRDLSTGPDELHTPYTATSETRFRKNSRGLLTQDRLKRQIWHRIVKSEDTNIITFLD